MGIHLADDAQVNLHTVRDVVGAACIIARVTPAGKAGCKPPGVYELAFELPSRAKNCAGQPPVVAYPDLLRPRRPFSLGQELALFDLKKVDAYLASFLYQRLANKTGQICLGGHHRYYSVGRAYAHQLILVCFDPLDRHFVFFQTVPPYAEIGRRPAQGLDPARIIAIHESALTTPQQLPLPFVLATADR